MKTKYWWIHHESECVGFTYNEDEIYQMQNNDLVEPLTEAQAQVFVEKNKYYFDYESLNN